MQYSYSHNKNTNVLTIYEDASILATVENVSAKNAREMFIEIVYEMRGIKID